MNLAGITAIRIPEGNVKSVTVGGRMIWQKPVQERYTELEYIESTGTQYIDTGIAAKSGIEVDLVYSFSAMDSANTSILFGAVIGGKRLYTAHNLGHYGYGAYLVESSFRPTIGGVCNTKTKLLVGEQSFAVSGIVRSKSSYSAGVNTGVTAYLFAQHDETGAGKIGCAKIYSCKIIMDGVLVRDFVPCRRNSDGAVGMYDRVTDNFFGNLGTGEFIAGEVTP